MLVLTRKTQQKIQIGDNITITIIQVKGQSVRVGIEAPRETRVLRAELPKREEMPNVPSSLPVKRNQERVVRVDSKSKGPTKGGSTPLAQILARRASSVDPATQSRYPQRSGPASLLATTPASN